MLKLKKFWTHLLGIVMVISVLVVGAAPTEAARLQSQPQVKSHKAIILVEDISNKDFVKIIDLSGIKKMSGATKWIEDNAEGKNLRFASSDPEMLDSWKNAAIEAGYKIKNQKADNTKISDKAKRALKKGTIHTFEVKTIRSNNNNDLEKGIGYVMAAASLWAAFH